MVISESEKLEPTFELYKTIKSLSTYYHPAQSIVRYPQTLRIDFCSEKIV